MKLIKVIPKTQAMYYRLDDNRIGVIYPNTGCTTAQDKQYQKPNTISDKS